MRSAPPRPIVAIAQNPMGARQPPNALPSLRPDTGEKPPMPPEEDKRTPGIVPVQRAIPAGTKRPVPSLGHAGSPDSSLMLGGPKHATPLAPKPSLQQADPSSIRPGLKVVDPSSKFVKVPDLTVTMKPPQGSSTYVLRLCDQESGDGEVARERIQGHNIASLQSTRLVEEE